MNAARILLAAVPLLVRASAPSDACALLTPAEVGAALGVPVAAGAHVIAQSPRICGWAPAGGPTLGGKKATVTIMQEQSFVNGKVPFKGVTKTPVAGIGDDAYYITTPGFGTAVNVKKANFYFQIRVGGFAEDKAKGVEKTLALAVITKL
jgi:hypothetical protein